MRLRQRRKIYRQYLDWKVILSFRILLLVELFFLWTLITDLYNGIFGLSLALIALILGFLIGLFFSRMTKVLWHEEKNKIITRMDRIGALILILNITFLLSRNWIFGHWLAGKILASFISALFAGMIIGRLTSKGISIHGILIGKGILKKRI